MLAQHNATARILVTFLSCGLCTIHSCLKHMSDTVRHTTTPLGNVLIHVHVRTYVVYYSCVFDDLMCLWRWVRVHSALVTEEKGHTVCIQMCVYVQLWGCLMSHPIRSSSAICMASAWATTSAICRTSSGGSFILLCCGDFLRAATVDHPVLILGG